MLADIFRIIGALFIVAIILFLAYYSSKMLGKGMKIKANGRNIKIIESVMVSQGTSLIIAKIEKKYYLFGASQGRVELIKEFGEDFAEVDSLEEPSKFQACILKMLDKTSKEA